jgi:outer membrane lipoprotein-sorting protein
MFDIRKFLATTALGATASIMMVPLSQAADLAPAAGRAPAPSVPGMAPVSKLSAAQIVKKHIAARGGAQAWKTVQSMQLSGKLEAGHGDSRERAEKLVNASKKAGGKGSNAQIAAASNSDEAGREILLPFTLDLKRPNRTRMEVPFGGKTAVQVFDGQHGWKLRPFLNRNDAEAFSADEIRTESARADLDGPLIGASAKGSTVELAGVEPVEGQPAYKLKVTPKAGQAMHVWIDAKSFLDVKVEGSPKHMDGKMHPVYVYQRDFRPVQGVMIPFVLETAVDGYAETHKVQVEKAAINPQLDDALFSKPHA